MKRYWPLFLAAGIASAAIVILAVWAGMKMADVEVTLHGFIAIGLGALGSLALSAVLFRLVFQSASAGHDERAHHSDDDETGRR